MLDIMSKINNHMNEKKELAGLIFLDLKKAFNLVLHDILLHHCGVVYKPV